MSDPSTFRAWLKRRRTERGLTQEDLGELVGYAAQTIRKIEGGQRRPSLQLALRLAQALELGPEEQAAWMNAARAVAEPDEAVPAPQPLRPPTPSPGLPTYLTPFVGRAQEQADLATLLARPDCRLITVLGPGGVGKTRLAIETARAVRNFADGIAFVSLAPVTAPTLIVPAVGDALGFAFSGTSDLFVQLVTYLRERRVLLLVDNLEHLLDAAGATLSLIEHLLAQASSVSVLATSRERLRLAGEWVVELDGLAVLQPHANPQSNVSPALTLFAEHAERVDRSFRLSCENENIITTICRMVDGLPLGIELAAAWTRLLSLDDIAQELARDLDTAHLSPRTLPTRHHSLRAVVDHSWQLLQAEERAALRQLSVFGGGFTREAALEVASANLHLLANLVDKSLLRRGANGRYDLHEIIRHYAGTRLGEHADERSTTRERHAAYFLRFVAAREQRLKGAAQASAITEISAETPNIRAAWLWAAAHGSFHELERAADALQWFCEFRSWIQEGAALFAEAVAQLRARGATADPAGRHTLGRLLGYYGYLAYRMGAFVQAQAALAESSALLADGADPVGLARTLNNQAQAAYWNGNYGEARRLTDQSLALTTTTGDQQLRARCLTVASHVAHAVGEYGEADHLFRAALREWRELGNPRGTVWCITSCSATLLARGKHAEVQQALRESLALSHTADDRGGTVATLIHLGRAVLEQGDVEASLSFFREALSLLGSTKDLNYLRVLNDLGTALWQAGKADEAKHTFDEALMMAIQAQAHSEAARAMIGIATYRSQAGDHAVALKLAARMLVDPASSNEARRRGAELQRAARAHLPADVAVQIEQQARVQPLAEVLAELALPGVHR